MSAPDINRVRDMYSWATGWRPDVLPDQPHMADVQATLRAEFDAALAAHDAVKRAEWEAEVSARTLPNPKGGCACGWHSQDAGGGYTEILAEYEPTCPEHSKHVYNPRTGVWELPEQGETEWEVEHGILLKIGGNWAETEWEPEHFDEVVAGYPHNEYVRAERKVTPWLPVPGSTVRESDSGVRESDSEESEGKA